MAKRPTQPWRDGPGGGVAIVTGGGSGLGRELCLCLARLGWRVTIADRSAEAARETLAGWPATAPAGQVAEVDVAQPAAVEELVRGTIAEHGRLDWMVNNAGRGCWGPAESFSLDQWRELIDVNLWGAIHGTRAAYGPMLRQGYGAIVNVSSLAGLVAVPSTVPYAAAKHAVVGLSRSLRAEAALAGVQVNVVCPGPFRSGFHSGLLRTSSQAPPRQPPADAADAQSTASEIVRGVFRDRPLIVLPRRARWLWRASRWWPGSLARLERRLAQGAADERPSD